MFVKIAAPKLDLFARQGKWLELLYCGFVMKKNFMTG